MVLSVPAACYMVRSCSLATVGSFLVGSLWYGALFSKPWIKLMVEHKGLREKSFENSVKKRWPYDMSVSFMSSWACCILRALFFRHIIVALKVTSISSASLLGTMFFAGVHLSSFHHYIWSGQRFEHVALDYGNELAVTLLTATTIFYFSTM
mmetsp:Transcript_13643/g.49636  ORF Transcript_13643/g.49636 Transcript_13643/m.49636 type:complete len:152 (+) Transcript_13643:251-706(+)